MTKTKITVGVGTGWRASGKRISAAEYLVMIEAATLYLLEQCGAYAIHSVDGGWRERDNRGELVRDRVEPGLSITVTVDLSQTLPPQRIAAHLRDIFDQKCVVLEIQTVNFQLI